MSIVNEILDYDYKDYNIKKYINIYKRTKKKRIKNKHWCKIFSSAIKERKIIKFDEIVLLDIEVYNNLIDEIDEKTKYLLELKGDK